MIDIVVDEHTPSGYVKKTYKAKQIFSGNYFDTYEYINTKGNKRKHTESKIKYEEDIDNEQDGGGSKDIGSRNRGRI